LECLVAVQEGGEEVAAREGGERDGGGEEEGDVLLFQAGDLKTHKLSASYTRFFPVLS